MTAGVYGVNSGSDLTLKADCAPGEIVVNGGYSFSPSGYLGLLPVESRAVLDIPTNTYSWQVTSEGSGGMTVYALCATT